MMKRNEKWNERYLKSLLRKKDVKTNVEGVLELSSKLAKTLKCVVELNYGDDGLPNITVRKKVEVV